MTTASNSAAIETSAPRINRRNFLQTSLAAAGCLTIAVELPQSRAIAAAGDAGPMLTAWLRIAPDDTVTVMVPSAEMGQGIATSLPMLVAEELEAEWSNIRIEFAPADRNYVNPRLRVQATFGSGAIRGFFDPLRQAGAAAREMLRQAAAQKWGVPLSECSAANGRINHSSGRSESYGTLVEAARRIPAPTQIALKPRSAWRIIGKPTPGLDIPSKVDGSAGYGVDVRVPGMLVATLVASPVFGGKLRSVDAAAAMAVTGVRNVVRLQNAVAVVADGYWPARKGVLALKPEWDEGSNAALDDARIAVLLDQGLAAEGASAESRGDAAAAFAGAAKKIEAVYSLPLLAHATMEPMNATARVSAEGCEIWAPTQSQTISQLVVSRILGMKPEQVKINTTFLGGGFGRKAEVDFVVQAALIAKEVGRPVKLIWSREEDIQHDFYRPAAMARLRAGLDSNGKIAAWHVKLVSPSLMARVNPAYVKDGVDPTSVEGLIGSPYAMAARRVEYVLKDIGVPVGFWRSVGNSISGFLMEAFIDEVAHAAGQDPVAFRRALLAEKPRHRAVLERAAALSGWGQASPTGRHRGFAMHEAFDSIVAEAIEISLDADRLRIHRIDCVVDCGIAVNPSTIVTQMESGIVYGLTAALFGEITVKRGRVEQSNFADYRMLTLAEIPRINVAIIEGSDRPGGIGEPSTPPIAPALVNAIFAATGKRLRSLPISKHGFRIAS